LSRSAARSRAAAMSAPASCTISLPLYFIETHWILQRGIAFSRGVLLDERISIYDMLETRFVGTLIHWFSSVAAGE
jgi:hypothetical protein